MDPNCLVETGYRTLERNQTHCYLISGLLQKCNTLFDYKFGTVKGVQANKLAVKPDAKPEFCRAQTTPYALCEAIEKDLICLQQPGVIESVNTVVGLCL